MLKDRKKSEDRNGAPATDPNWPRDLEARLTRLEKTTMEIKIVLGRTQLTLEELSNLKEGGIVETRTLSGMPMEILVNGTLFGKGEIVVIGDNLAVRVVDLVSPDNMVHG